MLHWKYFLSVFSKKTLNLCEITICLKNYAMKTGQVLNNSVTPNSLSTDELILYLLPDKFWLPFEYHYLNSNIR